MRINFRNILFVSMLLIGWSVLYAQEMKEINKTFEAKKNVRIQTVSGDCIIKAGDPGKITVHVEYSERAEDSFEADMQEKSNSLKLRERWYGSSSGGRVKWTVTVPPETEIEFSTASGDLSVEEINNMLDASTASGDITIENSQGEFEISTASGDINIVDSKGEFDFSTASGDIKSSQMTGEMDFSTASGDIKMRNSEGFFELSCASGDIDASGITIKEESTFSTASGDVEVKLAESSEFDLDLSTASGDVTLDYNGNEIRGYFEFTAKKRSGNIRSPIDFDKEEEYGRNGDEYMRKSFSKGGNTPKIFISTASGRVVLKD
ncbi:MAG: DUF4097 family beta strand repeat protein [Calditrichia bacterium]|nr:DUF4097 family beta strand repeat protein [Calditrichia bacterium]